MVMFKKRGERDSLELPRLPELPDVDKDLEGEELKYNGDESSYALPEVSKDIKNLPSFPDSDFGDSLSQEAVKSAIQPDRPNKRMTMEISEGQTIAPKINAVQQNQANSMPKANREDDFSEFNFEENDESDSPPPSRLSLSRQNEPVYIRIDKFKFAVEGFHNIKVKIQEVENYLNSLKDQKRKEDEELKEWEREIEAIKLRIEAIDNKIFSKI